MIIYETEVFGPNFYVLFTKDGKHVEFIYLTKEALSYESILKLVVRYESGFVYYGWSDSLDYHVLTLRDAWVVDEDSPHSPYFYLKFDLPKYYIRHYGKKE